LGHIGLFHKRFSALLFKTDEVMAPYCYRCPFNRAKPERTDARACRKCQWECLDRLEGGFRRQRARSNPYAAFVFEPLLQGAGGMIAQPEGWLARAAAIARENGALLIADEVMTGFGRTGRHLFACHREGVQPDFLALAKGLTGGYLPMAATLTTQAVFDAFLGRYEEFKTFFHGHSFHRQSVGGGSGHGEPGPAGHPRQCPGGARIEAQLRSELERLWRLPTVGDIRQVGLVAGIELVKDWRTRKPFDLRERAGFGCAKPWPGAEC
jgi:adenosylmethionine-8-amino-7-oxononanoate aminotransferase